MPLRLRIFVCVKTCAAGRVCCAAQNSRYLLDALRVAIMQAGATARHIDVQPTGCLDDCERGPIVLVFSGKAAMRKQPPNKFWRKLLLRPCARFHYARVNDAANIVDYLLQRFPAAQS